MTCLAVELLAVGNMIHLSEAAIDKLVEILADAGDPRNKLRVFVQGGGCSGFSYGFTLDTETPAEDDHQYSFKDIVVLVDAMSLQYMMGAEIDYKEDLMTSSFVVNNPQAESTCGCGSSFSIG